MKKKTNFLIIVTLLFLTCISHAQNDNVNKNNYLGASIQAYPAGIIPTINLEHFTNENSSFVYRIGANLTDRQDFSEENDHEEGSGFGGSVGYRKYFKFKKGDFFIGANIDLWYLSIDWENNLGLPTETIGNTNILVVQPWLEGGYFFNLNETSRLGLALGFGREINVITDGNDVAQDFIGSINIQYMFKI
ncbi:hypothetical protein LY01_02694 [Nonlabens xylanidelens]|uniref:Outer membrane protein with beta-barrel domain n=1 Tax=Nonlabens xylanidelens TaxID=191564 RepID=A0A2S6IFK0_9FLAO|nr:hypothetical protein [Nonlabens xylanidelens]PPK92989.1 hypothetical protein LY01_02694 [Nonlabens xylanidelens]PQJ18801.1 hypothetical protein BST94_07230 [Nonlabens xylanidelens]